MRKAIVLGLFVASVLIEATAYGQVRINEVGYAGVDFQGADTWVELYNAGTAEVPVADYWLCNFPNYARLGDLTVLEGSLNIPAGGYLVVAFDAIGDGDGELGFYNAQAVASADAMLDYVQYGSAGHERESVAVEAGIWEEGTFVEAAPSGQSLAFAAGGWGAGEATPGAGNPANPDTADDAEIDRFSMEAGMLFVRDDANGLPDANAPIDFDQPPFITQGFGPDGEIVWYYNFDVQPTTPAPIFVLFREGEDAPVDGQLNIIDAIPGDDGYNDFWQVTRVTVPAGYVANTITSFEALADAGYAMEATDTIVNCPVVPEGSTASLRFSDGESTDLTSGWYNDQVVYYFNFSEAPLMTTGTGEVPVSPILVTFNINPGEEGGGPPSGFVTEENSMQTHNVVATLPGESGYSPLWSVSIYDNADFDGVMDWATAAAATRLADGAALVNCPIVSVDMDVANQLVDDEVPQAFALRGNYPNPFNPSTTIQYELSTPGHVVLRVYDMQGRDVATLVDRPLAAGTYQAAWNGLDAAGNRAASGAYLYRLSFDGHQSQTRVMTLLK